MKQGASRDVLEGSPAAHGPRGSACKWAVCLHSAGVGRPVDTAEAHAETDPSDAPATEPQRCGLPLARVGSVVQFALGLEPIGEGVPFMGGSIASAVA